MSRDVIRSIPCHGYPFSNDSWSQEAVCRLRDLLANQTVDRERATGLVIGSGGLPYTLGYLGVSHMTILDRYPQVIDNVLERVDLLQEVDNWDEHAEAVERNLTERMRKNFRREFRIATTSGLRGDFECTQGRAATTQLDGHVGDAVYELPGLATRYRQQDRLVSFVNVTNVGLCLEIDGDPSPGAGRRALAGLLRELPLLDDAVIVESGPSVLYAHPRTRDEYFSAVGYK